MKRLDLSALLVAGVVFGWSAPQGWADDGVQVFLSAPLATTTGWFPPDCDLAVGPAHVVATTNEGIKVWTKSGFGPGSPPAASFDLYGTNGFWSGQGADRPFDPEVLWDPYSGRYWIIAIEEIDPPPISFAYYDIAVSATSDPTGAWHKYRLDAKPWAGSFYTTPFPRIDSPNVTVDGSWLYLSSWTFPGLTSGTGVVRTPVWLLNKAEAMSGSTSLIQKFAEMPNPPTGGLNNRKGNAAFAQKFNTADAAPQYMIGLDPDYPEQKEHNNDPPILNTLWDQLVVLAVQFTPPPATAPYLVSSNPITVATGARYAIPDSTVDQPPDSPFSNKLQPISARFWATAVYRDGHLYAVQHCRETGSAGSPVRARWFKIALNGWPNSASQPTIAAWGTIAPTGGGTEDIHFPSIGVNQLGQMLVTYNQSGGGAGQFISIRRHAIDLAGSPIVGVIRDNANADLGVFRPDSILSTDTLRWGDYSGTEADPSDPCTFWSHHAWAKAGEPNKWRTWLARTTISPWCPAFAGPDVDGNGEVDVLDFMEFTSLHAKSDPRADAQADSTYDAADFVKFTELYAAAGGK